MKKVLKKFLGLLIIPLTIGAFGFSFYSGIHVATSVMTENPKTVIFKLIDNATKSTKEQPIVVIIPERSLFEKACFWQEITEQREVVYIATKESTMILTGRCEPEESSRAEETWISTRDGIIYAYDWVADNTWRNL